MKCLLSAKPEIIKKLFNSILQNPTVIKKWHTAVIFPIHKKGSKTDANNYRGISLLSCLGKFFTAVLNSRLRSFVKERNILSKSQLGFIPGNRTSDALLILHNLIDFYCKKQNKYIFGCYVDFSKAFDSIPRSILFEKLLTHNINGKFYDCLTNLYRDDQYCVKIGDRITENFTANQGVKQGCILSPLLFNIFLSDLQENIEKTENNPVYINLNQPLGCLIWADDLLILSETEKGLNNMLKELQKFSEDNGLKVNMDKTKVMIFNKTGRHMRKNFYLGNSKVETTREYKYLGFNITPSGSISAGLHDLKDRALKAFYKLKHKMGQSFRKHPETTLKLFDSLIKPILLYSSDFWGVLKLPKNNPFENLHMKVCKQILGVQKQTTNIGVLLELGRVPLELYAIKNAIKNWARISGKENVNDLALKSYNWSLFKKLTWPQQILSHLSKIGMMESFYTSDNNTHLNVFQRLWDMFHQNAFADIKRDSSKLRTYSLLKETIGIEHYLSSQTKINIKDRVAFTKLRLSNHTLMIEKGRHLKLDKDHRFCPFCPTEIEDEAHFLITCECHRVHRDDLFKQIATKIPTFPHLGNKEKLKTLLCEKSAIHLTARYISSALNTRETLLKDHEGNQSHST